MEMPLEEGYVYGKAPKQPNPPPDIHAVFEEVGVPKGKLGELPYPKEWYDGAKERAKQRAGEMDALFGRKDQMRQAWVSLVLADCCDYIHQVDLRQSEVGPVLGLAELLARTAQERPDDLERIARLNLKADKAVADEERLKTALDRARAHLVENKEAIERQEREDVDSELQRLEEKRAEMERKRKAEKILARQAALLRGEEIPPSDDELAADYQQAEEAEDEPAPTQESANEGSPSPKTPSAPGAISPPKPPAFAATTPASFLIPGVGSPSPSPELRGGLGRQLPPLQPGGGTSAGASPTRGGGVA